MIEKGLFGFRFGLLAFFFLVLPGLAQDHDPAQCLVSGNYKLIRVPESKGEMSCRQDCVAEPDCHMAVVSTPLHGPAECLLVDCRNQRRLSMPRDPSSSIAVYPKSSDEVLQCRDVEDRTSFSSCRIGTPRFFYNRTSYRCERFFSGCGSSRNSFSSQEGCEALCSEKYLCYRPMEHGQRPPSPFINGLPPGPEVLPPNFFFYNVSSWRCEDFYFKGSMSNGNIFRSEEQCEGLCGGVGATTTTQPAVDSATTTSGPAVDSATTTSGPAVDSATTTTQPAVEPATTTSGPAVDSATTTSGPAVDSATTTTQPAVDSATTTTQPAVEPATTTSGPAVEPPNQIRVIIIFVFIIIIIIIIVGGFLCIQKNSKEQRPSSHRCWSPFHILFQTLDSNIVHLS
ncbi:uncharacterized protein LOC117741066 isoform X5 [Cyclopterus lumpus]|uniref:uncharacterized protein LOC117741066 isoform X5 n=1 Tax=Cyclopterus lumpus TaxID=8103 RepID=UPI001486169F|nr:uncharacterized protein LOC117741066 isoform X5 [Cyclopterus lumpus]